MVEQGSGLDVQREGGEADEGLDLEHLKDWAGFVVRAGRRRRLLVLLTFLGVAALGLTAAAMMPSTYTAQVKLFAQRSAAMRLLSSPNPEMNRVDEPTKNVATMILRRDNLMALIKQANLAERFDEARSPLYRLKDHLLIWISGPPSETDKMRALVGTLERKLDIYADDANLVITVDWPSAQMAYDLVTLVQKNFLEARYDNDVAVITDSISVLQEHAKNQLAQVDAALEKYQKVAAERATDAIARAARPVVVGGVVIRSQPAPLPVPIDPALASALEEKRVRIRTVEQQQQRTIEALNQQLVQAQLTLTPMHPTVIALQQQIDSTSQPLAELKQLRSDERALMAQIAPPMPNAVPSLPTVRSAAADTVGPSTFPPPSLPFLATDKDGVVELAKAELSTAIQGYETAMARIDAAKVELDITRAAYKHRYTVITPAELPSKPKKPIAQLVAVGSVIGALVLAFLLAALADLGQGRILESWQFRRRFKLDVLGEFDVPS
jgi:uncharacterized protein involved in exopolysaccharide biosynthesis